MMSMENPRLNWKKSKYHSYTSHERVQCLFKMKLSVSCTLTSLKHKFDNVFWFSQPCPEISAETNGREWCHLRFFSSAPLRPVALRWWHHLSLFTWCHLRRFNFSVSPHLARLNALFRQGPRQNAKLITYKSDHKKKSWLKKFAEASRLRDSKKVAYGGRAGGLKAPCVIQRLMKTPNAISILSRSPPHSRQ